MDMALDFSQVKPEQASNYYEYMTFVNAVREVAVKKLGNDIQRFIPFYFLAYTVLEEDIKLDDGRVEILSKSSDAPSDYVLIVEKDNNFVRDYSAALNVGNLIVYYPEYDIVLAHFGLVAQNFHVDTRSLVFATDEAKVIRFYDYLKERSRELSRSKVTVFTDTSMGASKSREPLNRSVSRDDVFLDERFKTEIFRSIDVFFNESKEFYTKHNIPYRRGILLYGKPGNGKTTLVKSIAGSINAPVIYWQITEFTNSESISEVLNYAGKLSPAVLVIEDIDSMPESARSAFLNSLDGATSNEGIFLIGTTNYLYKIDPALRNRAGRFDRAYEITLPNAEMRANYLKNKGILDIIDEKQLDIVVKAFKGFSIATLNEVYTEIAVQTYFNEVCDISSIIDRFKEEDKKQTKGISEDGGFPDVSSVFKLEKLDIEPRHESPNKTVASE